MQISLIIVLARASSIITYFFFNNLKESFNLTVFLSYYMTNDWLLSEYDDEESSTASEIGFLKSFL